MPSALHFLIAEDDPDLRFIITDLLAAAFPDATITAFENGRDALEGFNRTGADFVVSNHSMPLMNGPDFVRAVRQRNAVIPILMVSGSPEARGRGLAAGISEFLDKEQLGSHLVATVRGLLTAEDGAAPAAAGDL